MSDRGHKVDLLGLPMAMFTEPRTEPVGTTHCCKIASCGAAAWTRAPGSDTDSWVCLYGFHQYPDRTCKLGLELQRVLCSL